MRFVIEVVADDRDDAYVLLREAARKIKQDMERHGHENNHCIGDYRIFVGEDVYESLTVEHTPCEKGCGRHAPHGQTICISCAMPKP